MRVYINPHFIIWKQYFINSFYSAFVQLMLLTYQFVLVVLQFVFVILEYL